MGVGRVLTSPRARARCRMLPQNAPGSAALPFANFYGGLSGPEFIIPNDQTSASNLGANGGLANVVLNRPTPPPMP